MSFLLSFLRLVHAGVKGLFLWACLPELALVERRKGQ